MSRAPLTFYEFFAGGGMARVGLGEGWRCVFANDIDPIKAGAYRANFGGGDLVEGDVFDLTTADLPGQADLAWASSPCQDFSLAGARAGLAGAKSSALIGFWRLVEALAAEGRAPRAVVIENVTGLLTSDGGSDFAAVCASLDTQGYRFGAIEADAASFMPQSRRRVLIIGVRGEFSPLAGGVASPAIARAYERLPAELRRRWIAWPTPPASGRNSDLAQLLEPDDAVPWRTPGQTRALIALMDDRHKRSLDDALAAGERRVGCAFRRIRAGRQRAEVRFDGVAGCLRTPRGGSSRQMIILAEAGVCRSRLMTAREAARLMGLPDSYRLPASVTAGLHVTGDGVAAPLVRWLAAQVLEPALAPLLKRAAAA